MALYILTPGIQPVGDYDMLDTDLENVLGGEVGTLDEASRTNTLTEKAARDVLDGYVADEVDAGTPSASRVVLRLADETTEARKVFYLLDDGNANYGTLFGETIGTPVGLTFSGTRLGPHTAAASGKVTAWDKPGLYAVSTDAVADDLNPAAGNLNDTPLPGDALYRGTDAKLTGDSGTGDLLGVFVELSSEGSLVTTPARLVGATEVFDRVVFQYAGALHNLA